MCIGDDVIIYFKMHCVGVQFIYSNIKHQLPMNWTKVGTSIVEHSKRKVLLSHYV